MRRSEITVSAKVSEEYQTASRSVTLQIEPDDDPEDVRRMVNDERAELQKAVKRDLQKLLEG